MNRKLFHSELVRHTKAIIMLLHEEIDDSITMDLRYHSTCLEELAYFCPGGDDDDTDDDGSTTKKVKSPSKRKHDENDSEEGQDSTPSSKRRLFSE